MSLPTGNTDLPRGESQILERRHAFLLRLNDALRELSDSAAIEYEASRLLGQFLGVSRVIPFDVADGEYVIEQNYTDGVPSVVGRHPVSSFGAKLLAAYEKGETIVCTDVASDPDFTEAERQTFLDIDIRAFVGVSLLFDGKFTAGFAVHSSVARRWKREEVQLIEQTAARTWDAIRRARAEAALRRSEEQYRTLLDSIAQGFCMLEVVFDGSGNPYDLLFRRSNKAFSDQTGFEAPYGASASELIPGLNRLWVETYAKVAREQCSVRFENVATGKGYYRVFDVYASPAGPPGSNLVGVLFSDVTQSRKAEGRLRKSEARFRALLSAASASIYSHNADWTMMRYLEGQNFLEDTVEPSRDWFDKYIPSSDKELVRAAIREAIEQKKNFELEHRVIRADGTIGWVYSRAVPIFEDGEIVEWFGAANDVTRQRKAEDALVKTEKLAAMGRLAGAIAHEINNPLEAATNILYLLARRPLDDDTAGFVRMLDYELNRVTHITRQSLAFYRESQKPVQVSLSRILEEVLELLGARIQNNSIEVSRKYHDPGEFFSFPGEMRQVVLNLVGNAIDAMPDGGCLRVHIARGRQGGERVREGFRLNVVDTGLGISPEVAHRLFEPFVTTKEEKGTGLGLWVTRGILIKHEGTIRFRTITVRGTKATCFSVFLPHRSVQRQAQPEKDSGSNQTKIA